MNDISAVVLAAGKGTRMKSRLPKVMHQILGVPMLSYVLDLLSGISISPVVVVTGFGGEQVRDFALRYEALPVVQDVQLGTAHAVMASRDALAGFSGTVLIMCGDTPMVSSATLDHFLKDHKASGRVLSVLSATFTDPRGYGRIVRDASSGSLIGIVEERDAAEHIRPIKEVNTGIYAVRASFLFDLLAAVGSSNAQGEYYLTDIVGIAIQRGLAVGALNAASELEATGINSRRDLADVEALLLDRIQLEWMDQGVTFQLRKTCYIEKSVKLARDVVIGPCCVLKGNTEIGESALIGPYSYLENAKVEAGQRVVERSILRG